MDTRTNRQRFQDRADSHQRRLEAERDQHIFRTKFDLAAHLALPPHSISKLYNLVKWDRLDLIREHLKIHEASA